MYVNTLPQCSPASVGLTQPRPNNSEGKYTKPHPCIVFTLVCNCGVKDVEIGLCKFTLLLYHPYLVCILFGIYHPYILFCYVSVL